MNLELKHISSKTKIGHLDNSDVFHVATTGGLHLMIAVPKGGKGGSYRTLGAGPHVGIAKFLAEKAEPRLVISDLHKSEDLTMAEIAANLPLARRITATFQATDPR